MSESTASYQHVTLNDGTRIPIRQVQPSDADALQRFHLGLSDYSIYLRHVHALPRLTEDQLAYFTQLDGVYRFALVALNPTVPTEIIAVVRYEGTPGSDRAEYAALVTDAWQGKGLGTALTRALIAAARERGIRHFFALVLPENVRMMSLLRDLGYPDRMRFEDGIAEIEVDLTQPEGDSDQLRAEGNAPTVGASTSR